jgi:hypothetical protein
MHKTSTCRRRACSNVKPDAHRSCQNWLHRLSHEHGICKRCKSSFRSHTKVPATLQTMRLGWKEQHIRLHHACSKPKNVQRAFNILVLPHVGTVICKGPAAARVDREGKLVRCLVDAATIDACSPVVMREQTSAELSCRPHEEASES